MRAACSRQQPMQHHPRKSSATAKATEGNLGGFCVCNSVLRLPAILLGLRQRRGSRLALTNAVFDEFLSDRSGSKYGLRSIVLYDVLPFIVRRGCSD
jgi:hypothetical protein